MRLQDKVAIVTGGGSGFGAGICTKFVAEGARVLVVDLNEAAASGVATALGANALAHVADVARAADVRAMMDAAVQHFGRIDILVNNAGVTHLPASAGRCERGRLRPHRGGQHEGYLPGDARSRAAHEGASRPAGRASVAWC
jgi:NAD(P)-dependent dehydrogenase (short-subunit alcohol dehydrogenase family)